MPPKKDKKRNREGISTDSNDRNKAPKRKRKLTCPICNDSIEEASGDNPGQEAVFCDGQCDDWLHRQCAGLSRSRFIEISKTEDPFYCPHCLLTQQGDEIASLKLQLTQIFKEFSEFKNKVLHTTYCLW